MKNFIFTMLFFIPILSKAQVFYDVPLPLTFGKVTCEGYMDGALIDATSDGYRINSVLNASYPVATGKTFTSGGKEPQNLKVFATYNFNNKFNSINSESKFINYEVKGLLSKEFQILDKSTQGLGAVLAEPKDMMPLSEAGVSENQLAGRNYPWMLQNSFQSMIREEKSPEFIEKVYPPMIYKNLVKINIVGKVKGFDAYELTLKSDAERAKAKNSFRDLGIEGEYKAVEKGVKFDHFLDDPKNDKIRLMSSLGHELTGNVIACFSHPEKFLYKKFSFWGFDKDGKVLNSMYKDFKEAQEWPATVEISDSKPLAFSRPAKVYNYFLPSSTGDAPLYIVIQDKDGKVISDKTYPTNVGGGFYLNSFYNEDGSHSVNTVVINQKVRRFNTYFIGSDDKLVASSYPLDSVILTEANPSRNFDDGNMSELSNGNKVNYIHQFYTVTVTEKGSTLSSVEKRYDGFILATFDKNNKVVDMIHMGKGFQQDGLTKTFTLDSYDAPDGSNVVILRRNTKMKILSGTEYVMVNIDPSGKILNKDKVKVSFTRGDDILRPTKIPELYYLTPNSKTQSITILQLKKPE